MKRPSEVRHPRLVPVDWVREESADGVLIRLMGMSRRLFALVLSLAGLTVACADISLTTVDTHDRVISRHKRVVPGSGVRVRSRLA